MTNFATATYIRNTDQLQQLVADLKTESLLAVDTESNSLYAYQEQVCLVQLSTYDQDYIVDPLLVDDMSPLAELMADDSIQKVFHGAEYDVVTMKRDFSYEFNNLFDTMISARLIGIESVGLGSVLSDCCNVQLDKSHQRDNWGKRPLPKDSLRYAQMDTHFLPMLRDEFYEQLEQQDGLEEALEISEEMTLLPATPLREFDPHSFWSIGVPNKLSRRQMRMLRELVKVRDDIARRENRPPFKVMSNQALVTHARKPPKDFDDFEAARGTALFLVHRYLDKWLAAVERGKADGKLPRRPRHTPPDAEIADRYSALHSWRKERAIERGIGSDVIIAKHTLWNLAQQAPTDLDDLQGIDGIGPWRLANYGEEILDVLNGREE